MNCPIEWRYSNRIHLDAKETLLHVFELSTINTELFFLRVIGHLVYGHPPDISDTILVYLKPLVPCQPACKVPKCWITRSRCWLQHKESQGPALPWIIKVAVCSVTACFLSRTILPFYLAGWPLEKWHPSHFPMWTRKTECQQQEKILIKCIENAWQIHEAKCILVLAWF